VEIVRLAVADAFQEKKKEELPVDSQEWLGAIEAGTSLPADTRRTGRSATLSSYS
jgi:hypothetical protein